MVSYSEMQQMLEELLDELPEAFFINLNGGVSLLEEVQSDPAAQALFVLGEYWEDPLLGRGIVLFYGSFVELFGHEDQSALRQELRSTLRHEFRHHLEALSGVDDLDREDEAELLAFQRKDAARNTSQHAKQAAFKRGLLEGKHLASKTLQKQQRRGFWPFHRKD